MNVNSILVAIIGLFVIVFGSVYIGMAVGTSDFATLGRAVVLVVALAAFALLGKQTWVLIPVFAFWGGTISVLPLPFSVSNLVVGFAFATWLVLLGTRRVKWNFRVDSLDFWIVAFILLLGVGYLRNPVGVAALASGGNVGARPYFEVLVAFCGYLLLASQSDTPRVLRRIPPAVVLSGLIIAIGGAIAYFVPQIGMYMYPFYSGFMPNLGALDPTMTADESSIGRAGFLLPFALSLSLYLFARKPPLLNLSPFNPFGPFAFGLAGILVLLSGFRNAIAALGMYFIIGMLMWWRGTGLMLCLLMMFLGVVMITGLQSVYPLPERVQRTLSFLPGNWDTNVLRETRDSNEWRIEIWQEILKGDSIKNRWIGDGFGFPAAELAYYGELQITGKITSQQLADYYLITGDLHSGPLSALKFVGGVGLALIAGFSIHVAWRFIRLWRRVRYTPLGFPVAFYAINACYFPIKYIFIFGAFQNDLAVLIVLAGLLRMLENSTAEYEGRQAAEVAEAAAASPRTSEAVARLPDGRRRPGPGVLHA